MYDLRLAAEKNKKTLTNRESVPQKVSFDGKDAKIDLTREQFEEMTTDLLDRTIFLTDQLLEVAKDKDITKIDSFLLVGGSTRMLQIAKKITEKYTATYGIQPVSFDPDEAVAKGAGKNGQIAMIKNLGGQGKTDQEISIATGASIDNITRAKKTVVVKVASKTYGTNLAKPGSTEEYVHNLIFKQTPLPFETRQTFSVRGTTDALKMGIYASDTEEGQREIDMSRAWLVAEDRYQLGRVVQGGTPISEVYRLNEEGKLTLHASIDGCPPFKLEFLAEGALNEQEMDDLRRSMANINVT